MTGLNATELAARLGVTKPRISQYLASGKLDGCYVGEGRARRFDPVKVAGALGRNLNLGQMTGNGSATRRAIKDMGQGQPAKSERKAETLTPNDPDRLELATIQIKEEEARRRRRENAQAEGLWVLAEEVQRHTARALAQEISQFDTVLREAARSVADEFGVDARQVRKILLDQFRAHRAARADKLSEQSDESIMSETEKQEVD